MSQARRLNLYRPLLQGPPQPALKRRRMIAGALCLLVLATLAWQGVKDNQAQYQARRLKVLVEAELEKQHKIGGASEAAMDEKTRAQLAALEMEIEAKQAFLSDPKRFEPARVTQWRDMVEVLERSSAQHPDAWIERFDISATRSGQPPRVQIEGMARTQEAAFELIRAASNSQPLSQLSLLETRLYSAPGPKGARWAFTLKAGARP